MRYILIKKCFALIWKSRQTCKPVLSVSFSISRCHILITVLLHFNLLIQTKRRFHNLRIWTINLSTPAPPLPRPPPLCLTDVRGRSAAVQADTAAVWWSWWCQISHQKHSVHPFITAHLLFFPPSFCSAGEEAWKCSPAPWAGSDYGSFFFFLKMNCWFAARIISHDLLSPIATTSKVIIFTWCYLFSG